MNKVHISEAKKVLKVSQAQIGELMGCTQGNVHQAIKSGRDIYICYDENKNMVDWYEMKKKKPGTSYFHSQHIDSLIRAK